MAPTLPAQERARTDGPNPCNNSSKARGLPDNASAQFCLIWIPPVEPGFPKSQPKDHNKYDNILYQINLKRQTLTIVQIQYFDYSI